MKQSIFPVWPRDRQSERVSSKVSEVYNRKFLFYMEFVQWNSI